MVTRSIARARAAVAVPVLFGAVALHTAVPAADAGRAPATPQRPTFTSDAAIAPAGTLELESGIAASDGTWALPVSLRWTPRGLAGVELFASADVAVSESVGGDRTTTLGDPLTLGARVPLGSGGGVDWAVQPFVSVFHGARSAETGVRGGVNGIGAWSGGRHGVVLNVALSAAADAGPGIPARQADVALDWAVTVGPRGTWGLFAGLLRSDASDADADLVGATGVAWRIRPWLVLDAAVQRTGLDDGPESTIWLVGSTVNFGAPGGRRARAAVRR